MHICVHRVGVVTSPCSHSYASAHPTSPLLILLLPPPPPSLSHSPTRSHPPPPPPPCLSHPPTRPHPPPPPPSSHPPLTSLLRHLHLHNVLPFLPSPLFLPLLPTLLTVLQFLFYLHISVC